jgi:hypothetical protein
MDFAIVTIAGTEDTWFSISYSSYFQRDGVHLPNLLPASEEGVIVSELVGVFRANIIQALELIASP